MIYGVLIPAAVLGGIVLIVVLIVQRARGSIDLSPRSLLRIYLYLASLAGIVMLAIGLSAALNYGIARVAGDELIYGGTPVPVPVVAPACPPGVTGEKCVGTPEFAAQQRQQQEHQREHRRNEDLLRGVTFTIFGALFWGAHWTARRGLGEADPFAVGVRRGYLMLGTVVFGLSTLVLLPTGIYQSLANAILPAQESVYRQGADALGGGIVSLPIWIVYLRLVVTELRQAA